MNEDKIIVFLDDDPSRAALQFQRMNKQDQERTFWVKTVPEMLDMLKNYRARLDIVSLGYNLNGGECPAHPASEDCGLEVVRWLEKQPSELYSHVRFIVHTWNPVAGVKMATRLRGQGYKVIRVPFGS
jgi:hypothetical protein